VDTDGGFSADWIFSIPAALCFLVGSLSRSSVFFVTGAWGLVALRISSQARYAGPLFRCDVAVPFFHCTMRCFSEASSLKAFARAVRPLYAGWCCFRPGGPEC